MGTQPIRKVKENRVALTSYYGKVFVQRSDRTVHDYGGWLAKNIVAISNEKDSPIVDLHYGDTSNSKFIVPRAYSGISKRVAAFKHNDVAWDFDYSSRERIHGEDLVQKLEDKYSGVVCGKRQNGNYLIMDWNDSIIEVNVKDPKSKPVNLGPIEIPLSLEGNVPVEMAEINVFNKTVPVGIVLGYHYGISRLLKKLKVQPRYVPRGTRLDLSETEYAIRFKDETLILDRTDKVATLIMSGFNMYKRQITEFNAHNFNNPEAYRTLMNQVGLKAQRYLKEIDLMFDMFVDHITYELLLSIEEPTDLQGLLIRSSELLVTDDHPDEVDPEFLRYRGYERMTGFLYGEQIRSIRAYRNNPSGTSAKVTMNPKAVWLAINKDASVALVEESNPIHNLKEKELVTHSGAGGRSSLSMNRAARLYHKNNIGTISEATVDSSKVAVNVSTSSDPKFNSLRGTTDRWNEGDGATSVMSTSANISPASDRDDPKRINFISIQHSSGAGCENYRPLPFTTGYEKVVAHRVDDMFAFTAKEDSKVIELSDKHVLLQGKESGEKTAVEIGTILGIVTGTYIPHPVVTDVRKGQSIKKGDVVAWNKNFFERDWFEPMQVQWKSGIIVPTVFMESSDTLEDSSAIRDTVAGQLAINTTVMRTVDVKFDQVIHDLISVGDSVTDDTILCKITDSVLGSSGSFDSGSLDILDGLSAITPKADNVGKIERIEVVYNGDKSEMSDALRKLVNKLDKERADKVKLLMRDDSETGKVNGEIRVGGIPLTANTAIFKIYISKANASAAGDKGVLGNALKTIFGRVFSGVFETESGIEIGMVFAYQSVSNRIVRGAEIAGTANTLLIIKSKQVAALY